MSRREGGCGAARRDVGRRLVAGRMPAAAAALALLTACSELVRYTDELVDERTGRSFVVTAPATAGGFVGFVAGLPVDLVALPITAPIYYVQKQNDAVRADPLSTMLFPSFALWRLGTMIAVPFDAVEYLAWRTWQPPRTPNEAEREAIEEELDREALRKYPVEVVYP